MKDIFESFGLNVSVLLAGFFGALLLVKKQKKSLTENLMTLVTGSFSAGYVAPFLANLLNIQHPDALTFMGFVVGYGGIQLMDVIMNRYVKKKVDGDV